MFRNIGGKIKGLAVFFCVLGMLFSLICACNIWVNTKTLTSALGNYITDIRIASIIYGALVLVLGCLASWVGTFCLYGFGELISKTCDNNRLLTKLVQQGKLASRRFREELPDDDDE